jgi:hypothetical protein
MNERIDKLIEECTDRHFSDCVGGFETFDKEKFAELIVRECVQSIEKTIETSCDTDSEKMGCEFAITDMLGHFGVEL